MENFRKYGPLALILPMTFFIIASFAVAVTFGAPSQPLPVPPTVAPAPEHDPVGYPIMNCSDATEGQNCAIERPDGAGWDLIAAPADTIPLYPCWAEDGGPELPCIWVDKGAPTPLIVYFNAG